MNISDLSRFFRPSTLTKLNLEATRFLSAKKAEKEIVIRSMKVIIREGEMLRQSY